jgi:TRAP-type C4-dicarboxylate transport system permease small subunit
MIRYTTVWLTFVGAAAASLYGEHMDMNLYQFIKDRKVPLKESVIRHIMYVHVCAHTAILHLNARLLRTYDPLRYVCTQGARQNV